MAQSFQITQNEIVSGITRCLYDVFGDSLFIYREKEQNIQLPAVTVYCINYEKVMERVF